MDDIDIHYFENDFIDVVAEFIRSIVEPSMGFINYTHFSLYLDLN